MSKKRSAKVLALAACALVLGLGVWSPGGRAGAGAPTGRTATAVKTVTASSTAKAGNTATASVTATAGMNAMAGEAAPTGMTAAASATTGHRSGEVQAAAEAVASPAAETAASSGAAQAQPPAFLAAIGIPAAWDLLKNDVAGTIAIVDTGVDLNNARLAPYLTKGVNLLDGSKQPQDDNGHGTAVAGILAEIAEASASSSSGAKWRMKMMPVKALDRNGEGDEGDLALGIRYAVEHGADIVVLSLGLRRDSSEMREVVAEAESKGVLLVAASGNDAATFGAKAAVQYPAAYPTVLAVAGATAGGAQSRSTSGPEVDVSAPWTVRTLKLGGGTVSMEGTSMSAPQAAGVAAMLLAQRPDAKPAELRDWMKRTALDIADKGWDRSTGYGQVRADLALKAAEPAADWHEPNDSRAAASVFPIESELQASWSTAGDVDEYKIDVPYDGELKVVWSVADSAYAAMSKPEPPHLKLYRVGASKELRSSSTVASSAAWSVAKGQYYLVTSRGEWGSKGASAYRLVSSFKMAADAMEPNQTSLSAYTLAPRSQTWTGTFDTAGDEDWAVITLPQQGKLRIRVETDTTRIDPAVMLQRAGEKASETDLNGDGASEEIVLPEAEEGRYYIRVRNAVSTSPAPVIGTYTVHLEYSTPYEDPNEPNDGPLSATPLKLDPVAEREGLIDSVGDKDWFRFELGAAQTIDVKLAGLPGTTQAKITLYDKTLRAVDSWSNSQGKTAAEGSADLQAGSYYLAVSAERAIRDSLYRLTVRPGTAPLAFADVKGHWAEQQIRDVASKGWMAGYSADEFGPNRKLTRAEATVIAVRAFHPAVESAAAQSRFTDVAKSYWAYASIIQAEKARWLGGFAGTKFKPDTRMTRGEAAMLIAKAAGLAASSAPQSHFADVPANHAAAGAVEALLEKGWISGFPDGTFRPDQSLSRAEWAVMLDRLQ